MQPLAVGCLTAIFVAIGVTAASAAPVALDTQAELAYVVQQCAGNVAPALMRDVILTESRGRRLAVNVNGNFRLPRQPASDDEAVATVRWLEQGGYNFDVGYSQVNSANFAALGVDGAALFNGCTNVRAGAAILAGCYARAAARSGEGQAAVRQALSCYNTGSMAAGFANGYVRKVVKTAQAAQVLQVPALMLSTSGDKVAPSMPKAPPKEPAQEGELGAFGSPDTGAFGAAASATNKSGDSGSSKTSVPYSRKAASGGVPEEKSHEGERALPGAETLDSDVPGRRTDG